MLFVALAPVLIVCLAFSLFVINQRFSAAEAALAERGAALVRQLAPAAEYGSFSGNLGELKRLAEAAAREADVHAVSIFDANGQPLIQLGKPLLQTPPSQLPPHWQGVSDSGTTLFFHAKIPHTAASFDDPFRSEPGSASAQPPTLGSISVELSRASVIRTRQEILLATAIFSLLAMGVGSLLARRLSRDVSEPIFALQQTVASIRQGQLDARVAPHLGDILNRLEDGVNEMAAALQAGRDQLEQRIREATAELRDKKEEAERMNFAKTRFLAAASHDLRQPLHALTLFTDELAHYPDMAAQSRLLKQVRTAVDAMNQQLSALLDISRLDMGNIGIQRRAFALQPVMERIMAVHAPDAQAKGLRLSLVATRACTHSDPRLFESMLGNLLSNAVRYTRQGGIVMGVRRRGEQWHLEIWDSGIGIHPKQFSLIFQEFYQVANPERDASKGLGIGLSIVSRLSELLQHPVDVRSIPGRGTVFGMMLPMASAAEVPLDSPASPHATGEFNKTVIVLGKPPDESGSCICGLLEQWGCQVQCIESADALEQWQSRRPDALIFGANECLAAQRHAALYATPPLLIQVGLPSAGNHTGETPGLPPYSRLNLPLRPARLRALLQSLFQTADERETSG